VTERQGCLHSVPADERPNDEPGRHGLTRREREVARLIGQGLTSRQIAERLIISKRTVDAHAEHIRTKLGVHSRAQIAAWAVDGIHHPDGAESDPAKPLATPPSGDTT